MSMGQGRCGGAVGRSEARVGQGQDVRRRRKSKIITHEALLGSNTQKMRDDRKHGGLEVCSAECL